MLTSKHIICTSMPRSGHHLLVRLLTKYYQDKFIYCDYYGVHNNDCCGKIPCLNYTDKLKDGFVFMQKSHDHALRNRFLYGYKYIAQYRHPIPRSISNFRLYVKKDLKNRDTKEGFRNFLDIECNYYVKFYKKWLLGAKNNIFMLKYEDLAASSLESIKKIVKFIDDNESFDSYGWFNAQTEIKYGSNKSNYKKNDIFDFKFFDEGLLKEFEEKIFYYCPDLEYDSYF